MIRDRKGRPALGYILGVTVLFTYLLMLMGTLVTSTGSGLACPDWPLCYGSFTPPLQMGVWIEWSHRLLGGVTGLLIVISTIFVWRSYRGWPRIMTTVILGLLLTGVILGGITVLTEAPLLNSFARVAVVSSHLVIATLVLTCLVFTLRYVAGGSGGTALGYSTLLFGAVYFQVILGILVRYSGATLACGDLPFCNGGVVPEFTSYLVALHFAHRVSALLIFVLTASVLYRSIREDEHRTRFAVVFGLVCIQAAFGILIVATGMFLPVIIMHGATGFGLLAFLAYHASPELLRGAVERRTA
jgi:cytochrome c oxidase assembly protein subunit 15